MLHPAPTSRIDPSLARAVLLEAVPATATKPAIIRLGFTNTSYQLSLIPAGEVTASPGKRVVGVIRAKARRIDVVDTGGRYVEPVIGRPRRVQGTVLVIEGDALVIGAGLPIHCTPTDPRQKAQDFTPGQLVSFDVMDLATFTPSPA